MYLVQDTHNRFLKRNADNKITLRSQYSWLIANSPSAEISRRYGNVRRTRYWYRKIEQWDVSDIPRYDRSARERVHIGEYALELQKTHGVRWVQHLLRSFSSAENAVLPIGAAHGRQAVVKELYGAVSTAWITAKSTAMILRLLRKASCTRRSQKQ